MLYVYFDMVKLTDILSLIQRDVVVPQIWLLVIAAALKWTFKKIIEVLYIRFFMS